MSRRQDFEAWLDRDGVHWEYLPKFDLRFVEISDLARSQIRLDDSKKDQTVEYYCSVVDTVGAGVFPPMVLNVGSNIVIDGTQQLPRSAQADMIDGIRRWTAFRAKNIITHDVYIVKTDNPNVLSRLRRTANLLNGEGYSRNEKLAHAIALVREHQYTQTDAAKTMGIPTHVLRTRLIADAERNLLGELQIEPTVKRGFSDGVLVKISRLRTREHKKQFAELMIQARLLSQEQDELLKELANVSSDREGDKVLTERYAQLKDRIAENQKGRLKLRRGKLSGLAKLAAEAERLTREIDRDSRFVGVPANVGRQIIRTLTTLTVAIEKRIKRVESAVKVGEQLSLKQSRTGIRGRAGVSGNGVAMGHSLHLGVRPNGRR